MCTFNQPHERVNYHRSTRVDLFLAQQQQLIIFLVSTFNLFTDVNEKYKFEESQAFEYLKVVEAANLR